MVAARRRDRNAGWRAGRRGEARPPEPPVEPRRRGRFEGRREGDGWVVPEAPGGAEDVHLTASRTGGALPGDRVEVEVLFRARRGRLEGRVVRLESRGVLRVVGQLTPEGTVVVWDRRWAREIRIPPRARAGAAPGELVRVRIRREFDAPDGRAVTGEVDARFGRADDPAAERAAVLARFGLRDGFPEAVLGEASRAPAAVRPADREGREDHRGRLILTVDPKDARDHDDAVSATELPDGGFEIGVHIADVAHYVPADGAVDEEARRRGTAAYFPEGAAPMLPPALSSGICSLVPGEDRLVRSVTLRVGPDGRVVAARFGSGVIRSAARLSYGEAARMIAGGEAGAVPEAVRRMGSAAALLGATRRARGAVDLDLPEPAVAADAEGNLVGARYRVRTEAHRLVEEFMLVANEAAARRLEETAAPALHRVHAAPSESRLRRFEDLLAAFGERLRPPSATLRPEHCARFLARIEGRPEARFLRRRLLRAMRRAAYSPRSEGHFALALMDYTHFTSPIRRYPDLVVHRALGAGHATASGKALSETTLAEVARSASAAERSAESAERELVERRIARWLAARLGDTFPARVSETGPFGLGIDLEEIPARGAIPLALLGDGDYRFDRRSHSLRCRETRRGFRIGDALEAQLVRVERYGGGLTFAPVAGGAAHRTPPAPPPPP